MATYKEIHGTVIETVTSDPSNPVNGQVWYNSTDQVLKGFTSNPAGSWASASAMSTTRWGGGASTRTPRDAILVATGGSTVSDVNVEVVRSTGIQALLNINKEQKK